MNSVVLDRIVKEYKYDLIESALTVVIGDEIVKPELMESCVCGGNGRYNLVYRRQDKSKRSCGLAITLESLYGRGNSLEKNLYLIKTSAKELMLEGELNDE
nr:MAG TPA: hypothetical protein [Caudoviricetes sp.]